MPRERGQFARLIVRGGLVGGLFWAAPVFAQGNSNSAPPQFHEIETKYIFGFTEGSGIGLEGEKEFSIETEARIGKATSKKLGTSRYFGSETKLEFEFTPNQYIEVEFG